MTGTPTILVQLDDGTGAWPYDVSSYVSLSYGGISWFRGRADQFQTIAAGQATVTLENLDGRFSIGAGGFGTGPYGSTPFGGGPSMGQGVRIKVAGQTRFTGRIISAPVSWPSGADNFSITTITASDDLDRAARHILGASVTEEILADSPTAYYTLGEADGATQAADTSGNRSPALNVAGSGAAMTFGADTGLTDITGATFAGGKYLAGSGGTFLGTGAWTLEAVVVITAAPVSEQTVVEVDLGNVNNTAAQVFLDVTSSGRAFGAVLSGVGGGGTGTTNICDGQPHHLAITFDGAGAFKLYVDGAVDATAAGVTAPSAPMTRLLIGNGQGLLTGTVVSVALTNGTALSAARIAAHAAARLDFRGETPTARITRVATYANIPVGTLDTTGTTLMGPTLQAGRPAADVWQDVTDATQGVVYVDATGAISNVTGRSFQLATSPAVTFAANDADPGSVIEVDMAQVVNKATGTAAGSENVTFGIDAASIAEHGVYPNDYTWNVSTDTQATDLTNWQVNTYAQPQPRIPTLKLDVLTMSPAGVTNALLLELGVFASVSAMPTQTPGGDLSLIVEGISETVTDSEWSITVNGVRHALTSAWILGDSVLGVLGSTTKLSY